MEKIKERKNHYQKMCLETSCSSLKESLIEMCVAEAQEGTPFEALMLPFSEEIPEELRLAYNKLVKEIQNG